MADTQARACVVGAPVSRTRTASTADVKALARMTGNTNPIHLDSAYAVRPQFGRRTTRGMLGAGYNSAILGTVLPRSGTSYLGQTLSFKAPIYIAATRRKIE